MRIYPNKASLAPLGTSRSSRAVVIYLYPIMLCNDSLQFIILNPSI
jgi:hypothetical protein